LKERAGIAAMIRSVRTDMKDDLAARHARRFSAGESEFENLFEIIGGQTAYIGRVPVVDLFGAFRQRLEFRQRFGPRRLEGVRLPLQMMLKDSVVWI
jgi:hypothetical protein